MKYSCELLVHLSRDRIVELFDNQDNLYKWQEGLQSFEHLQGEAGKPGAISKLTYNTNGRKMEIIETISTWNAPEEFVAIYESGGVWNEVRNSFTQIDEGSTRWLCENEFRIRGFFRLVAFFFPGMFKKQTIKFMKDFKNFAEKES